MRFRQFLPVLLVLFFVASLSACVIRNQKGGEVSFLELETAQEGKEAEKTEAPEKEPLQAQEEEKSPSDTKTKEDAEKTAGEGEDFTAAPWFAGKTVGVKDLDDSAPSEFESLQGDETPRDKKPAGEAESDLESPILADEPDWEEEEEPDTQAPVRRVVAIDRHLQPVSADLWKRTYHQQTSKTAPPARRASMSQVNSAVESGYGSAYVAKLERAISLDRENGYAYYFLARGRFEKNDWKGARNFADKAVQKLGRDIKFRSAARVVLSKSLSNLGNLEEAAKEAREAVADDPGNTEARILALRFE